MKKQNILFVLTLCLSLISVNAYSKNVSTKTNTKNNTEISNIATINMEEILKNSAAMLEFSKNMEKEAEVMKKKFEDKQKKLEQKQEEISKKVNSTPKEELQKEIQIFQQEVMNLQSEVKYEEDRMRKTSMEILTFMSKEINNITQQVIEDKVYGRYDVVFTSSVIIASKNVDDISSEILRKLNKQFPNFKQLNDKMNKKIKN